MPYILERSGSRRLGWLVLALLLLATVWHKLEYGASIERTGAFRFDGGFYTNVAQNVRDGNGLKTHVSLYHKGFPSFPYPSSIYPLWPLLHGYAARYMPLQAAAVWVPTALYYLSLLFAYLFGRALFPGPLIASARGGVRGLRWLNAGHLIAALFAVNPMVFIFTSHPFTEALSFALAWLALWRSVSIWRRPGTAGGLELGFWVGLTILARTQLLPLAIALVMVAAYAWVIDPERRRDRAMLAAGAAAGLAITLGPYLLYLRSFLPGAGFFEALRFDAARPTKLLTEIPMSVKTSGVWAYIVDRAQGFPIAFGWNSKYTFKTSFHTAYLAFPALVVLALPMAIGAARRRELGRVVAWLRDPDNLPYVFVGLLALGNWAALHTVHKAFSWRWNFGWRHALSCSFLFFGSLVMLFRMRPRGLILRIVTTATAAAIALSAFGWGVQHAHGTVMRARPAKPFKRYDRFVRWITEKQKEHEARGETLVIAMPRYSQRLGWRTYGVGYHWMEWITTQDDVRHMFDDLGADYLLTPKNPKKGRYRRPRNRFDRLFKPTGEIVNGWAVFVRRPPAP